MTLAIRGRGDSSDLETRQDGTANAILTPNGGRGGMGVGAVAIRTAQTSANGHGVANDVSYTLDSAQGQAVAFAQNQRGELRTSPVAPALNSGGGKPGEGYSAVALDWQCSFGCHPTEDVCGSLVKKRSQATATGTQVRRLTPRECERLQGFPDDYTLIPLLNKAGKPNGRWAKDGPRYKALGNSMCRWVMYWLGKRIQMVEECK